MKSLFQAGGALPVNHSSYVKRQADQAAFQTAQNGEYLQIIAPRQMGKTSLIKRLAHRLNEMGWRCAYVDLSLLMGFPKAAWYSEFGKILGESLTPGQIPNLTNQIDLRRYLLDGALPYAETQPYIALCLDEVEGAGKARDADGKFFSDTFFMTLRNLYNQRDDYEGTLVVVLAGAVDPDALVTDPDISPFNVGQEVSLDDFTIAETRTLTNHLTELDILVDKAVYQAIYDWTDGHPYLTQRLCQMLEQAVHLRDLTTLTANDVTTLVEQSLLEPASPLERDKNLKHVSKMSEHLSAPAAQLWSRLRGGETVSRREANDSTFLELYLTGAIKTQTSRLIIRNHIYEKVFGPADSINRLQLLANRLEDLIVELLQNAPINSRVDPTWRPSRWRKTDPDYQPTPQMEYSWRKPLPDILSVKQREARRRYRSWYYQVRALVNSSLAHELSSFDNTFSKVLKFIEFKIGAPANAEERNRLVADFRDCIDHQRSILDALADFSVLNAQNQRSSFSPQPQSTQANPSQRCIDLADNIRETLDLIKQYEDQRRLDDDPKVKRRAERKITDLREQLSEYEAEARELGCEE